MAIHLSQQISKNLSLQQVMANAQAVNAHNNIIN